MISQELHKQMLRMLDGELGADEAAALEAELLKNPESRTVWHRLARIHSALESRYAAQAAIERVPVVPIERVITLQRRRVVKISLLAAAAVLMFTAAVLWMVAAPDSRPALATLRTAPQSVFTVTHAESGEKSISHLA
ncbi:MAG TPA: hypothetical protein VLO11_04025, partial [Luteolibacter sp.]|nr:hypothetical protein [Luteolibacter sp.]